MPPDSALDPRAALMALVSSLATLVGGKAYVLPASSVLADDGLTERGQQIVREGREALAHIEALAATFGCALRPPHERPVTEVPGLPPHVRETLRKCFEE